jgi:hypothetical protein
VRDPRAVLAAHGQSYLGELLLGPAAAPTAMTVPMQITRTP